MVVDCLVIGGGVIGLTTAWKLAQQGFKVRVVDQSLPGREASWAGAGILPPGCPSPVCGTALPAGSSPAPTLPEPQLDPLTRLTAITCDLWPQLSAELLDTTGIDNEFHRCGGVELALGSPDELLAERLRWEAIGARTQWLPPAVVRELEPAFSNREAAFLLPDLCQVRNPRHLQALLKACQLAGVEVTPYCPVTGWTSHRSCITASVTSQGEIAAGQFCVTAGAWSSKLLASADVAMEVIPVRGQIVLLRSVPVALTRVFERGKRYLVPRRDGLVLIGSTEELAGFEKSTTDEGVQGLLDFAAEICPSLRGASVEQSWSGLRPCATRGRPFIGPAPGWDNLMVATGHYRSGLHLSPATAEILVSHAQGRPPATWWSSFGAG